MGLAEVRNSQARRFTPYYFGELGELRFQESAYERSLRAEAARRYYNRLNLGREYPAEQVWADLKLLGRVA